MKRLPAALLSFFFINLAYAQSASPFHLEKVESAFEQMRSTPGFDISKPLQWGFFFISSSKDPLFTIRKKLEAEGYRYIEEHRDENGKFWLQLAKTEIHTPVSLHMRNEELFNFAKKFSGVVYDGWDVSRQ